MNVRLRLVAGVALIVAFLALIFWPWISWATGLPPLS